MTTSFDPAAWLSKAEAAGYEVLYVQPGGEIWFVEPAPPLSTKFVLALWNEYRPTAAAAENNSKALRRHLMLSRRITFDHQPPVDVRRY